MQRRAEGGAGVTRRGLDPDALERPLPGQAGVGHAVEGDPVGHGEVGVAGAGVQPAGEVEDDLLQAGLHARCEVGVLRLPRAVGRAGLCEGAQVERLDHEPAVVGRADRPPQLVQKRRLPVGGEGHHLVLVGRAHEAEVGGDLLVEQAEGVGQRLGGEDLELAVDPPPGQVRRLFAPPVEHEHARRRPRRGQMGRGGVGHVVGHESHRRGIEAGQGRAQEAGRPLGVEGAQALPSIGRDVGVRLAGDERGVVGVGDGGDLVGRDPGLAQAPAGGLLGQLPGAVRHRPLAMLAPAEALLLGGGHDLAVDHQGRRGVVKHSIEAENEGHEEDLGEETGEGGRLFDPPCAPAPTHHIEKQTTLRELRCCNDSDLCRIRPIRGCCARL